MKHRKRKAFDLFARDYRSVHNKTLQITGADSEFYSQYKVVEVLRKMKDATKGSILDLGCGDGTSLRFFREYFPNHLIHGIDVSIESIRVAQSKEIANCQLSLFDGINIPFEEGCFDIVFLANVLHHIPFEHHDEILVDCRRVLKAGGNIFIFEHNPLNPITRRIFSDCIFDRDAKMIYHKALCVKMKKAGYEVIKTSFHLFFPRHKIFSMFHVFEKHLFFVPMGGQYCLTGEKQLPESVTSFE